MNQPPLPFKHLTVPDRHVKLLATANAADYPERKYWFYPFKTRFCRAHALPDGLDLQVITIKCYCGDGIFRGIDYDRPMAFWERCHRCGGTGIYLVKNIVLIRWLVNGHLFHEPSRLILHTEHLDYRERFEGLIKHAAVDPKSGRRAMESLMLRYEPRTFYALWLNRWQRMKANLELQANFKFRRVRQLLSVRGEVDDVPF